MADEHEHTSAEEQALADEWASALAEAGDANQDDIDALLNQGPAAKPAPPRAPPIPPRHPEAPIRTRSHAG